MPYAILRKVYAVRPTLSTDRVSAPTPMDESATDLPPSIAAAWGIRAPVTKGPRPGLTLERIVAAGIAVADADGLAAVSMNRVAKELGSSAMSLYRYVGSKDELLTLMVDTAFGAVPPVAPGEDWRAGLARWAWGSVQAMRAHPWSVHVPITGPPLGPNATGWFEDALRSLRGTALAEAEKASIVMMLSGYVRNHVLVMGEVQAHFLNAAATPHDAMRAYSATLRRLTDTERFPALHVLLDAGVFDQADPPDEEFTFGLERILDGIDALMRARARAQRR
jgi:AcrR family transcriptional regulator